MPTYVPEGPPEKQHTTLWVANRMGDNLSRCWAASFSDKGHDVTLVDISKSNENPISAWGKLVIEQPGKGKSSTDTKKKKKG
eukprot:CAMPEP_0171099766 /NCGR_PEP_ID=MMETSP0766_2-20121228/52527_1 /TAXON_ID=439317 /ORGANISM="Gambierdiscus australes, Strain CAWD 149" /LENGTH=81 /DNA_ID=CAMNT_0011559469 /DNA_START=66 /DNA_END=311 /DNA_ORIENTATION=+